MEQEALIALGSNQPSPAGAPAETLRAALAELQAFAGQSGALRVSRFFRTPAFPPGSGPDFVNACAALLTDAAPAAILQHLHAIEARLGRARTTRWAARTLDLDLLAFGDMILPTRTVWQRWAGLNPADQAKTAPDELILPHPRLQDRAFVLVPLADIAADWHHPVTGLSVSDMRDALPAGTLREVVPL